MRIAQYIIYLIIAIGGLVFSFYHPSLPHIHLFQLLMAVCVPLCLLGLWASRILDKNNNP